MGVAASRPKRLLPLRIVAALLLLAGAWGLIRTIADRYELLAGHPALTEKMIAVMIVLTFVGSLALVFLAFFRQRFGLWFVLACAAIELALETWVGFDPLYLLRIPIAAALVYATAWRAWPDLRGLKPAEPAAPRISA